MQQLFINNKHLLLTVLPFNTQSIQALQLLNYSPV